MFENLHGQREGRMCVRRLNRTRAQVNELLVAESLCYLGRQIIAEVHAGRQ
jgi:hypothetical protein